MSRPLWFGLIPKTFWPITQVLIKLETWHSTFWKAQDLYWSVGRGKSIIGHKCPDQDVWDRTQSLARTSHLRCLSQDVLARTSWRPGRHDVLARRSELGHYVLAKTSESRHDVLLYFCSFVWSEPTTEGPEPPKLLKIEIAVKCLCEVLCNFSEG